MATTYQNYERVNEGLGVRYRDAKTGRSLTQDEYERLWMRENGVKPQLSVVPRPRGAPVEGDVGRKEGLAKLNSDLGSLFGGEDFESRLKRGILTLGLSEERGRRMYSDTIGNAALLSAGGAGLAADALKFGALKFGTEMFTHGDVRKAGEEALDESAAVAALGALGKAVPAAVRAFRSPAVRKAATVLGAGAAASQAATGTPEDREAALDWKTIMTDIQQPDVNSVPASASVPLETALRARQASKPVPRNPKSEGGLDWDGIMAEVTGNSEVRQASKAGDSDNFKNSRNFLATDRVPDTIFGFPVVSRREDYTEEDLAFFGEHPEAGGYYDMEGGGEEPEPQADELGGTTDDYAARVNGAIADALPFVKEHEGFRGEAYKDAVGVWTIGYGQTELDGRPVKEGDVIDEKAAAKFVETRLRDNAAALYRQNKWTRNLSRGALAALYDTAYNLGAGAFSEKRSPNLNAEMESADMDFDSVLWRELPTYVKAGGKWLQGLVNRRRDAIRKWRDA